MPRTIDNLPVKDARKSLVIRMVPDDITKAKSKEPSACAVARACIRETSCLEARVHLQRIYIRRNESHWERYQTPSAIRNEIIAFDRGGVFEPRTFTLKPVPPADMTPRPRERGANKTKRRSHKSKNIMTAFITKNVRSGPG